MSILRTSHLGVATLAAAAWLAAAVLVDAQKPSEEHKMPMAGHGTMMHTSTMTREQKIANAMSAAPSPVSGKATILDWPAKEGDAPPVLRQGTNGWRCFSDMPMTEGNDPMCLDAQWMNWVDAYMTKKAPRITAVGIGYMIAPGGAHGSNTDPFATAASPDNAWAHHPPHMMILVPDLKSLDALPTDPANGGPYVMFKGTPYAHIIAPVAQAAMMHKGK